MADESPILQVAKLKKEPRKRRKQKRRKNPANQLQHNHEAPETLETQEQKPERDHSVNSPSIAHNTLPHDIPQHLLSPLMQQPRGPDMLLPPSESAAVSDGSSLPNGRQGYLSPRKEALKRHEHKREPLPEFLSEAKKNMKPTSLNGQQAVGPDTTGTLNGGFMFTKQNMDGKSLLITVPLAQIVVYHDTNGRNASAKVTSGALLASGVLEIFQLHNGDVTYMSCGESFVYPLLPKLNILRTSELTFVLPLANPRRYWKILLHAANPELISKLEIVLQIAVQYTNVVSSSPQPASERSWDQTAQNNIQSAEEMNNPLLSSFFDDVPPSPPSVSASPPPETTNVLPLDLNLRLDSEIRNSSMHVAANNGNYAGQEKEVYPVRNLHNSHHRDQYRVKSPAGATAPDERKHLDEKADSSSMDSLLDEYEETLSVTRSMSFYEPSSNIPSLPLAGLQFPSVHQHPDMRDSPSKLKSDLVSVDYDWSHFKRTAGRFPQKRYNNPSHGGRSRKSSTSDLYTSVSNWMEPGQPGHQAVLPHSRSIRSLASRQSFVVPNQLFDAYRETSISASQTTLHRDKAEVKQNGKHHSKTHPLLDQQPQKKTPYHPLEGNRSFTGKAPSTKSESRLDFFTKNEHLSMKNLPRNDGLTPSEVYDLIRNRDNMIKPKSSGIRGLFGW